jgi:hypothetical protein
MNNSDEKAKSPFFRTVMAYHNELVANKDMILADLQMLAESGTNAKSITKKLKKLATLEVQVDTIRKHFGQEPENEKKPTQT